MCAIWSRLGVLYGKLQNDRGERDWGGGRIMKSREMPKSSLLLVQSGISQGGWIQPPRPEAMSILGGTHVVEVGCCLHVRLVWVPRGI